MATAANRRASPATGTTRSAGWRSTRSNSMRGLGHASFAVIGHDRGGRVAARMALDHPACRDAAHHTRCRADARDVRANLVRLRARLLALVHAGASRAVPGDADPRGPGSLSQADHRRAQRGPRALHRSGLRGISALPVRSRYGARHLRGLPRERDDRPRTRPRDARFTAAHRLSVSWRCGARKA